MVSEKVSILRDVAQLVARLVWERAGTFRFLIFQTLKNPCKYSLFRTFSFPKPKQKSGLTIDLTTYKKLLKFNTFYTSGCSEAGIAPHLGAWCYSRYPHSKSRINTGNFEYTVSQKPRLTTILTSSVTPLILTTI